MKTTKKQIVMKMGDFKKEHKKLIPILKHGSNKEQYKEGVEQSKELKKVIKK